MRVHSTALPGVLLIEPQVHRDERGYFLETWQRDRYREAGLPDTFVQDNESGSARHTLRGLHYQLSHPQGKLVRVTAGEVFDVAVDIRRSSPTFGRWYGALLSAENGRQLWIPPGFAHGFLVTSERAVFVYKCTDFFAAGSERSIAWNDPDLAIDWPLAGGAAPNLSPRDAAAPRFRDAETFP
jgi:dTDP-4-dehydrorhamnose 3,5-epimerase